MSKPRRPIVAADLGENASDEGARFKSLLGRVLRVSKDELQKREVDYQKSRQDKPKPGPRKA